jgi:hypothetical protein
MDRLHIFGTLGVGFKCLNPEEITAEFSTLKRSEESIEHGAPGVDTCEY